MCGINGIFSNALSPDELRRKISLMNEAIIHRGPDSDGIYNDDGFALGFRRPFSKWRSANEILFWKVCNCL